MPHRYTEPVTPSLATIDWHRFLQRPPLPTPSQEAVASLIAQPILITGAGGSIGSALARRLASVGAQTILLESSETALYELQRTFSGSGCDSQTAFHLGSALDLALLDEIFALHRPGLAIHAAAFKHVPLLEEQPLAAIVNNVFATEALIDAASAHHARVVLLSTDKAVAPVSVMGATKRVAEQIVIANSGTVLRLANVLASRGSVAEVFAQQVAVGSALTVTDPAARRYFLTIREAVDLLLTAACEPDSPALFVPNLPGPHFIADLARFMARTLAPDRNVSIEFTHPRAGDKESEALSSAAETLHPARANGLVPVASANLPTNMRHCLLQQLRKATDARDLPAAVSVLRKLVPEYTPSSTLRTLHTATPQVAE